MRQAIGVPRRRADAAACVAFLDAFVAEHVASGTVAALVDAHGVGGRLAVAA